MTPVLPDKPSGLPQSGREVLAREGDEKGGPSTQPLAPFFECWLDTFIFNGHLDPKLRELAILRMMWRCRQSFEWGNHYRLARNAGLSPQEIVAVRTRNPDGDLQGDVAVVVRAADEVVDIGHITAHTYTAVREVFPESELVQEFLYLVAGYRMFASVSATTQVTAESRGMRMWPPDGRGPEAAP